MPLIVEITKLQFVIYCSRPVARGFGRLGRIALTKGSYLVMKGLPFEIKDPPFKTKGLLVLLYITIYTIILSILQTFLGFDKIFNS